MITIAWVLAKNTVLYFSQKDRKDISFPLFLTWVLASIAIIEVGIYAYDVSLSRFQLHLPYKARFIPYILDGISNFWVSRSKFSPDISGVLSSEVWRGLILFLLTMCMSFIFSASFWVMIVTANLFHLRIAGYQY